MKAVVFKDKGRYQLKDVPIPRLGNKDVLIKVDSCGICGTDVHIYEGSFPANFPVIIGHEFAGTIQETGEEVEKFKPGDPVTVNPNTVCGECEYCRGGKENLCITLPGLGVNTDGGFAQYLKIREASVYHLPEGMDLEVASFTEPLSCCVHGVDLAEINSGDSVVVLGAGPIGLLILQLVRLAGAARVIITATRDKGRELAQKLGADLVLNPREVDVTREVEKFLGERAEVVIECVGKAETMRESLNLVRPRGRVVWFGVANPKLEIRISPFHIYRNEITLRGAFVNPYTTKRAIDLLASGRVRVKELITHRYPLDQLDEAMRTYKTDKGRVKIMMKPWM